MEQRRILACATSGGTLFIVAGTFDPPRLHGYRGGNRSEWNCQSLQSHRYNHTIALPGLLFTLFFGAFFFSIRLFTRRAVLKLYAQKPDRDMEVTWEISDDGIRAKTELMASENKWAVFQKAVKAKEGFLLYPSSSMYHWIPMRAFRDGDAERFAELAKEKVKDYQQKT